jgi:hypothetical protein
MEAVSQVVLSVIQIAKGQMSAGLKLYEKLSVQNHGLYLINVLEMSISC